MITDLAWWVRLVGLLTVEMGFVFSLGLLAARLLRNPHSQRAIWQWSLIACGLALAAELAGFRNTMAVHWSTFDSSPKWRVTVSDLGAVSPEIEATTPQHSAEPIRPSPHPISRPPIQRAICWPASIWLAGAAILALRAILARIVLWLRVRRSLLYYLSTSIESGNAEPVSELESYGLNDALPRIAHVLRSLKLRRVRLLLMPRLNGPVAFGILRPTIALPSDFAQRFSSNQRDAMMAHELAHLAARDPVWLAVADLLCAFAWWSPPVWLIAKRFRAASEQSADTASRLVAGGPLALAESLLQVGRTLALGGLNQGIGVAGSGLRSELAQRVSALVNGSPGWRPVAPSKKYFGFGCALAVCLAVVAVPIPVAGIGSPAALIMAAAFQGNVAPNSKPPAEEQHEREQSTKDQDSVPPSAPEQLYTRTFPVNVPALLTRVKEENGIRWLTESTMMPNVTLFFQKNGVDFAHRQEANGTLDQDQKALFLTYKKRILFVRATLADLDLIGRILKPFSNTNFTEADLTNVVELSDLSARGNQGHRNLDRIVIPKVEFHGTKLSKVATELERLSRENDPEGKGIKIILQDPVPTDALASDVPGSLPWVGDVTVTTRPPASSRPLNASLASISAGADPPIHISLRDNNKAYLTFYIDSGKRLSTRTYRVDTKAFAAAVRPSARRSPGRKNEPWVFDFFDDAGVWFPPSPTESAPRFLFYDAHTGLLFVRGTDSDLQIVDRAIAPYRLPDSTSGLEPAKNTFARASDERPLDPVRSGFALDQLAMARNPNLPAKLTADPKTGLATAEEPDLDDLRPQATRPNASASNRANAPSVQIKCYLVEFHDDNSFGNNDIGLDWLVAYGQDNNAPAEIGPPTGNMPGAESPNAAAFRIERYRVTNQWSVITRSQFDALRKRLTGRLNLDLLTMPSVTAKSGQQAQVRVASAQSIVAGPTTNTVSSTNGLVRWNPQTAEPLSFGPSVDLTPSFQGDAWNLSVTASYSEFLGYEDPGKKAIWVDGADGRKNKVTQALPMIRTRIAEARATCKPGEIIALRGPTVENVSYTSEGFFRRKRKQVKQSHFYVFLEPTKSDATSFSP